MLRQHLLRFAQVARFQLLEADGRGLLDKRVDHDALPVAQLGGALHTAARDHGIYECYAASRALSIGATMSAGLGAAKRSPWQTRQPASARNSRCAWVSTPFATTSKLKPRARAMRARARPARSLSSGMPATSLRSMHTAPMRRRCSIGSEA